MNSNLVSWPARALIAALAVTIIYLVPVVNAAAAPGQLTYGECHANTATPQECAPVEGGPLDGATGVAVSPDDKSVYVVSKDSDSIAVFSRAPDGKLTYGGCHANSTGPPQCHDVPGNPLFRVASVAVSPDGNAVYVASAGKISSDPPPRPGALVSFARSPDGSLAFKECISDATIAGCTPLNVNRLTGATDVVVSPDSASVYTTSSGTSRSVVSHFARNAAGNLSQGTCWMQINNSPLNCRTGEFAHPNFSAVAVSPDGASVYATTDFSLASFSRAQTGPLERLGCVTATARPGCDGLGNSQLVGAGDVAVSPDGTSVYVAANTFNTFALFTRHPNGTITHAGCFSATNSFGTCNVLGGALGSPRGVAVAPDGESVYVAAGSVLGHFTRAESGQVAYDRCFANDDGPGECRRVRGKPLTGVSDVAVSGDSRSVYVVSDSSDSISHFFWKPDPPAAPPAPPESPQSPPPPPPSASPLPTPAPPLAGPSRIGAVVVNLWAVKGARTRVLDLVVTGVPKDGSVTVTCNRCSFKTRTVRKGGRVKLTSLFRRRTLKAGTVLELRITAPGVIGHVVSYRMRKGKLPSQQTRCLPPGAKKPLTRCS